MLDGHPGYQFPKTTQWSDISDRGNDIEHGVADASNP
jgi:hypothetical protein